jgi:hypothetical protein
MDENYIVSVSVFCCCNTGPISGKFIKMEVYSVPGSGGWEAWKGMVL